MKTPDRFVICASRVVSCDPNLASAEDPLGVIVDGAVLVEDGVLAAVGAREMVLDHAAGVPVWIDAPEGVLTPGLVDAHTHLAWAGSRHDEYALRMAGASYEAIAAAGGGIVSTMRAVRTATEEQLLELTSQRLRRMAQLGVTACEIKSGYGLDLDSELKQLRAIASAQADTTLPRVVPTFLALHALPPEAESNRDAWVRDVAYRGLPAVAAQLLAQYVDAYIDRNAFTVEEARLVFSEARRLGLGIRAHVGQFADVGGADLAAELGAVSVDHLEHVSPSSLQRLAASGTRAILLPMASFALKQTPPPVAAIRSAGIPIVVASDANPGTAPTESLALGMALAVRDYGLTPEETILAATREAAASIGLGDVCGQLACGREADMVVWDVPHERALVQPWGSVVARLVLRRGRALCG